MHIYTCMYICICMYVRERERDAFRLTFHFAPSRICDYFHKPPRITYL